MLRSLSCLLSFSLVATAHCQSPPKSFETQGDALRQVVVGKHGDQSVLYTSGLEGGVGCYQPDGTHLWSSNTGKPAVLFEINAHDLDGDGRDELLAASGDGFIHCWGADGKRLWKFNPGHKVRFSELAIVPGPKPQIFAGGNDYTLYELDASGNLASKTPIKGMMRSIEAGYFRDKNAPSLFVMTYSHDKFRWRFLGYIDPKTKETQASLDVKKTSNKALKSAMFTDFATHDLNGDGLDEILLFGTASKSSVFLSLNEQLKPTTEFQSPDKDFQRYAHAIGTPLPSGNVLVRFGRLQYLVDPAGNVLKKAGAKNKGVCYNDVCVDPSTQTLFFAGDVSGGNAIYANPLKDTRWFEQDQPVIGRMAEVQQNLQTLHEQAKRFTPPPYQKQNAKPWVMIGAGASDDTRQLKPNPVVYVRNLGHWSEGFDRAPIAEAIGEIAYKVDRRKPYKATREQLVAEARKIEATGEPFVIWAGHGTDPFYMQVGTLEAILQAAPTTCYGFIYAEMHNGTDPRTHYFINEYIPRLAAACRKQGRAKLYFRHKNMFWAASVHLQPWKKIFLSGDYKDVLVPASEDTSSRTQDLNFAGRVGMWMSGAVDDFAIRLIDDNPTSWRPLTPGGQGSISPYLRSGLMRASYGARYAINFGTLKSMNPSIDVLYALMATGALPQASEENLASVGSWHLIQDMDAELVHAVDNHHNVEQYDPADTDAVFSVTQMHWAGTDLPDHDFSKTALGVDYRWLSYLPTLPNGMVPIAASESAPALKQRGALFTTSNGTTGQVGLKPVAAPVFGEVLKQTAKQGGQSLPVLVTGAAWSAIRLDDKHIRVILIDPGYITPKNRQATIRFNGRIPTSARDILRREDLKPQDGQIQLIVPAGSARFIDLSYQ